MGHLQNLPCSPEEISLKIKRYNTLSPVKTNVTTSATFIKTPENCTKYTIYHTTSDKIVWLGGSNNINISDEAIAPLPANFPLKIDLTSSNDNNIWGIVESGSVDIFVIGWANE